MVWAANLYLHAHTAPGPKRMAQVAFNEFNKKMYRPSFAVCVKLGLFLQGENMSTSFKVGDIVQLKSGGPEMTVQRIPTTHNHYYDCQWFAVKKLESGHFPADSLQPVNQAIK